MRWDYSAKGADEGLLVLAGADVCGEGSADGELTGATGAGTEGSSTAGTAGAEAGAPEATLSAGEVLSADGLEADGPDSRSFAEYFPATQGTPPFTTGTAGTL